MSDTPFTEATVPDLKVRSIAELGRRASPKSELQKLPLDMLPRENFAPEQPYILSRTMADGEVQVELAAFGEQYRTKPTHRRGTARATTLSGFIALVNRHADAESAIFAGGNWRQPSLLAVIDYHKTNPRGEDGELPEAKGGEDMLARTQGHRIDYTFPLTDSWAEWMRVDGTTMTQGQIADFIEAHIHEIGEPTEDEIAGAAKVFRTKPADPAELMGLAQDLEITVGEKVTSRKRVNGETIVTFETNVNASIVLPTLFILSVQPFHNSELVRIPVRLRHKPKDGTLQWSMHLHRAQEVVEANVRRTIDAVRMDTALPVYEGSPEGRN